MLVFVFSPTPLTAFTLVAERLSQVRFIYNSFLEIFLARNWFLMAYFSHLATFSVTNTRTCDRWASTWDRLVYFFFSVVSSSSCHSSLLHPSSSLERWAQLLLTLPRADVTGQWSLTAILKRLRAKRKWALLSQLIISSIAVANYFSCHSELSKSVKGLSIMERWVITRHLQPPHMIKPFRTFASSTSGWSVIQTFDHCVTPGAEQWLHPYFHPYLLYSNCGLFFFICFCWTISRNVWRHHEFLCGTQTQACARNI